MTFSATSAIMLVKRTSGSVPAGSAKSTRIRSAITTEEPATARGKIGPRCAK